MAGNEVRIIGGKWRGRKLRFPAVPGLRPTLGRARETLFNWLAPELPDARCLDLFAGSGALGFEALSRGAGAVTFVESDRKVAQALKDNAELLDASSAQLFTVDAKRFLTRAQPGWHIIFLDPPFASDAFGYALELIAEHNLLHPDGLVYFERPRRQAFAETGHWRVYRDSHAGDTRFGLLSMTRSSTGDHTLSV